MSLTNVENWEKTLKSLGFVTPSERALKNWQGYYQDEGLISLLFFNHKCGIGFDFYALASGEGFLEAHRRKGEYWVLTAPLRITDGIESTENQCSIRDFCNYLTSKIGLDKVATLGELFLSLDTCYDPYSTSEPVKPHGPKVKIVYGSGTNV